MILQDRCTSYERGTFTKQAHSLHKRIHPFTSKHIPPFINNSLSVLSQQPPSLTNTTLLQEGTERHTYT